MTLPIFEAMRLVEAHRVPVTVDLTKAGWFEGEPDREPALTHNIDYRAIVSIQFSKIGPEAARDYIKQEATRSIAHHIYGPITRELIEVTMELRRLGPEVWPMIARLEKLQALMEGRE